MNANEVYEWLRKEFYEDTIRTEIQLQPSYQNDKISITEMDCIIGAINEYDLKCEVDLEKGTVKLFDK